jgi:hypothetical protein
VLINTNVLRKLKCPKKENYEKALTNLSTGPQIYGKIRLYLNFMNKNNGRTSNSLKNAKSGSS